MYFKIRVSVLFVLDSGGMVLNRLIIEARDNFWSSANLWDRIHLKTWQIVFANIVFQSYPPRPENWFDKDTLYVSIVADFGDPGKPMNGLVNLLIFLLSYPAILFVQLVDNNIFDFLLHSDWNLIVWGNNFLKNTDEMFIVDLWNFADDVS